MLLFMLNNDLDLSRLGPLQIFSSFCLFFCLRIGAHILVSCYYLTLK